MMINLKKVLPPGHYKVKFSALMPEIEVQICRNAPNTSEPTIRIDKFNFEMNKFFESADWKKCA